MELDVRPKYMGTPNKLKAHPAFSEVLKTLKSYL